MCSGICFCFYKNRIISKICWIACKMYCHIGCRDEVPGSCGVDPVNIIITQNTYYIRIFFYVVFLFFLQHHQAKQLTQRTMRNKLDSKESDLFLGVMTAFTAPDQPKPGNVIIAHCLSVKVYFFAIICSILCFNFFSQFSFVGSKSLWCFCNS